MTTAVRNEAAERLFALWATTEYHTGREARRLIAECLAAERRATVDRIRARMQDRKLYRADLFLAILDEKAVA